MQAGSPPTIITLAELLAAFAPTLGREKSQELLAQALEQLGLHSEQLTRTETLMVLDLLNQQGGMTGVTARFVRLRLASSRPVAPRRDEHVPPSGKRVSQPPPSSARPPRVRANQVES